MALLVTLFGGAVATGLLDPLTPETAVLGLVLVFVLRPLAGVVGLLGSPIEWSERASVAFFGIRGIGSFYYLAYALNQEAFAQARQLWALVGFVVLVSIVVHGVASEPVMNVLERRGEA
jgi:NhaP-type Na+/H+ or K+/H+ antiporter